MSPVYLHGTKTTCPRSGAGQVIRPFSRKELPALGLEGAKGEVGYGNISEVTTKAI